MFEKKSKTIDETPAPAPVPKEWTLRDLKEFLMKVPDEWLDQPTSLPRPHYSDGPVTGAEFKYVGTFPGKIYHQVQWKYGRDRIF